MSTYLQLLGSPQYTGTSTVKQSGGTGQRAWLSVMFPVPSLMAALSTTPLLKNQTTFLPSLKANSVFVSSAQALFGHNLLSFGFRFFPTKWRTASHCHLVSKVCCSRTLRWAWQPTTGAIKVREKEESESPSPPPPPTKPANPFSFLERFPFFNLPFTAATSCNQPEQICVASRSVLAAHTSKNLTIYNLEPPGLSVCHLLLVCYFINPRCELSTFITSPHHLNLISNDWQIKWHSRWLCSIIKPQGEHPRPPNSLWLTTLITVSRWILNLALTLQTPWLWLLLLQKVCWRGMSAI